MVPKTIWNIIFTKRWKWKLTGRWRQILTFYTYYLRKVIPDNIEISIEDTAYDRLLHLDRHRHGSISPMNLDSQPFSRPVPVLFETLCTIMPKENSIGWRPTSTPPLHLLLRVLSLLLQKLLLPSSVFVVIIDQWIHIYAYLKNPFVQLDHCHLRQLPYSYRQLYSCHRQTRYCPPTMPTTPCGPPDEEKPDQYKADLVLWVRGQTWFLGLSQLRKDTKSFQMKFPLERERDVHESVQFWINWFGNDWFWNFDGLIYWTIWSC